jgi:hypothetical protein
MIAGIYRIYNWKGFGWLAFPLDVTWGLPGNTIGTLFHLVNLGWGDHSDDTRLNLHRYASGITLSGGGLTAGNVISHVTDSPPTESYLPGPVPTLQHWVAGPTYRHEATHVLQNRAFGPFHPLSYFGWMFVWLIPGMIAGLVVAGPGGIFTGAYRWCYMNNPWEAWAYDAGDGRGDPTDTDDDKKLTWSSGNVRLWSIPFFLIVIAGAIYLTMSAWSVKENSPPPPSASHTPRHSAPSATTKPKH